VGSRKRQLAPADMPVREVQKIAKDKLRPVNQELALTGSVLHFSEFMISTYVPTYLPLLSSITRSVSKAFSRNTLSRDSAACVCVTSRSSQCCSTSQAWPRRQRIETP
jgi:hypothetical protein